MSNEQNTENQTPQGREASELSGLLSTLQASIHCAASMLDRDDRPARTEAAADLRKQFYALRDAVTG